MYIYCQIVFPYRLFHDIEIDYSMSLFIYFIYSSVFILFPLLTYPSLLFPLNHTFFSIYLSYNVLSISAMHEIDPVIHIYIQSFSYFILPYVSSQVIRFSSLSYIAGYHCLSTPNAIVLMY